MIYVNRRLQYLFDSIPIVRAEEDRSIEFCRLALKDEEKCLVEHMANEDWDVLYKNGNSYDLRSNNLEAVIFKDDDFFKDNKYLENQMLSAKKIAKEKEDIANKAITEKIVAERQIELLTKQVSYEQDRVKRLNKALNEKEAEIKRLMKFINKNC